MAGLFWGLGSKLVLEKLVSMDSIHKEIIRSVQVRLQLPIASVTIMTAAVFSYSAAAVEPASVKVGMFDVVPTLELKQSYDDNIFSTPTDEKSSWVSEVTPGVSAVADSGIVRVAFGYELTAGSYAQSHDDDYVDHTANADFGWELNDRNQIDLSAEYVHSHEERGSGFSEGAADLLTSPDEFQETTVAGMYTLGSDSSRGRLELTLSNYEKEYTNHRDTTRNRDRDGNSYGGIFYWNVAGRTRVLAEVTKKEIEYKQRAAQTLDSDETNYLVGVTWEATGKTEGTIKVGRLEKKFNDDARDTNTDTNWSAEVKWAPKTYSVLTLTTSSGAEETNGVGSYIDVEDYAIEWAHDWSDVLSSSVYYSYSDETYIDSVSDRKDDITGYGVRVSYDVRRWLTFGLSAVYDEKDSSFDTLDYERTIFALDVSMSL